MKNIFQRAISLSFLLVFFCACNNSPIESDVQYHKTGKNTRAYGDKSPKIVTYVETDNTNPLNAGDYLLSDSSTVVDIVELYAAYIEKRTVDGISQPILKLNDKLTRVLEPDPTAPTTTGYHKYVEPLQEKGIKVLLSVTGNWFPISFGSMNDTQTTQFANILAYVVDRYNLDGIGFVDKNTDNITPVEGSYGSLIGKLHNLMPSNKLITVFQWGNYNQINMAQGALIDYAYQGYFGASAWIGSSSIPGITNDRWSPICINMGFSYTDDNLVNIYENAFAAAEGDYGVLMTFGIRSISDNNPQLILDMLTYGAYDDAASLASTPDNAGDRPQDWDIIPGGLTFTIDDVNGN